MKCNSYLRSDDLDGQERTQLPLLDVQQLTEELIGVRGQVEGLGPDVGRHQGGDGRRVGVAKVEDGHAILVNLDKKETMKRVGI